MFKFSLNFPLAKLVKLTTSEDITLRRGIFELDGGQTFTRFIKLKKRECNIVAYT